MRFFGIVFPLACIGLLLWVEQYLVLPYAWKTVAKACLFLLIPLILFRSTKFPFLRFQMTDWKSIHIALIAGIVVLLSIIGAFFMLLPNIDTDALLLDISDKGVTPATFPFIALYILIGNSLMEEFFFRGLLPSFFKNATLRLFLPSFFFAIYHIAIFLPWFSLPLLLLAVAGLWIGGIIFQLANARSGTILPSWMIHMFADIGVLLVGVYLIYL